MDVRLPDGTVIRGVPDGMSKAELVSKLSANGYDTSWYKSDEEAPQKRSIGQELLRQVGLTARAGAEGLGSIPQILGGAMEAVGVKGAGANVGKQIADVIGLPSPETDIEKVAGAASSAMAGGMPFLKAGQAIAASPAASETAKRVGTVMASQPAAQLGLAGVSGGASEAAKVGGLGGGAQLAAGLAAPLVAAPIASAALGTGRLLKDIVGPISGEAGLERGAARLAARTLGKRAEQAATALGAAADDLTAGQVAAAIDNADLAALQRLANQRDASLTDLIKRGTEAKMKRAWDSLEERLSPIREQALALADKGGVDSLPILRKVALAKNARGDKTNPVVQNSMRDIEEMLSVAIDKDTGLADPVELNNIRKQIRNLIEKHSAESKQWDSKRTAGLERQIQLAIDDAIESGISKADPSMAGLWANQYMAPYREGANKIRAAQANLDREIELASKGMPEVSKIVSETEVKGGPNFLNRTATLINFAARAAEGSASRAVEKKLAQMMAPSEFGGDKKRLAELMRAELNRPQSFFESFMYRPGMTRAESGYGGQEPAATPSPTSRIVGVNKDIPYSGFPVIQGAPPLVPGSWRGMMQPDQPSSPLPVLPDELLPLSQRYAGTSMPIGLVESGGPVAQNVPLPKLPPVERGMLGLSDVDMPIPDTKRLATRHDVPTMEFDLKLEVLQKPEIRNAIENFVSEAERLRNLSRNAGGFWKERYASELAKLEDEFAAGMKMLGVRDRKDALGLVRLYESGGQPRLQIEKTRGLK